MTLLWIVLLPLFGSLMALLGRNLPRSYLALVVALFPISALALLLQLLPAVLAGQAPEVHQLDWLPLLGLSFTLLLDGLSLLFALLILGIGSLGDPVCPLLFVGTGSDAEVLRLFAAIYAGDARHCVVWQPVAIVVLLGN